MVQISTLGVYNRAFEGSGPVPETLQRGDSTAYGNSKAVQELVLEAYQRLFGFELMMVRLAHVFGLGHFQGGAESGAITHTLLTCGREGGVAKIARRQARPLERIYAKDVGRAVDLAATVPVPPVNVFNIGTGLVTTFDELVEEARAIYPDLDVEVVPDGDAARGTQAAPGHHARQGTPGLGTAVHPGFGSARLRQGSGRAGVGRVIPVPRGPADPSTEGVRE